MRIVLDTNVLISGIFFSGPPHQILEAWRDGIVQFVVSPEILDEYYRVSEALSEQFPEVDVALLLDLVTIESYLVQAPAFSKPISDDPDDDKFLACALSSNTKIIVSGDKHLLKLSGYCGVDVVKPSKFVNDYLSKAP